MTIRLAPLSQTTLHKSCAVELGGTENEVTYTSIWQSCIKQNFRRNYQSILELYCSVVWTWRQFFHIWHSRISYYYLRLGNRYWTHCFGKQQFPLRCLLNVWVMLAVSHHFKECHVWFQTRTINNYHTIRFRSIATSVKSLTTFAMTLKSAQ